MVADNKKIRPHRKNRVTHTILDFRPEFFLSAAILCSLKPSLANNIVTFQFFTKFSFANFFSTKFFNDIKIFFGRLAPKNQYNFVQTPSTNKLIVFRYIFLIFRNSDTTWQKTAFYQKNHFFHKSNLTTNIFMLVNLEPIFGFILEINSIPNQLHGHTVAAMCFNMGYLVKKVG